MARTTPLAFAALAAALLVAALSIPVAAEGPTDGRCDSTGRLVCAGANAGGNVECGLVSATTASCSWTRGFIWAAYSPIGLPGESRGAISQTLSVCVAGVCDVTSGGETLDGCSWIGLQQCKGDGLAGGSVGPIALSLGQCLVVTVTQSIGLEASVATGLSLARATWSTTGSDAGAVCLDDNGRD